MPGAENVGQRYRVSSRLFGTTEGESAGRDAHGLGDSRRYIAVWIYDLIIDGLNSGEWHSCEEGPAAALAQFLHDKHGGGLAAAAEGCFEMIYGCDPYTLLMRVDGHGAPRPGSLTL
jgi:hypothetical protein